MSNQDEGTARDRELGMGRRITRRDFLNGVAIGVGALAGAAGSRWDFGLAAQAAGQDTPGYYPPALTGMRGSHDGSFDVSHALRDGRFWNGAGTPENTGETYDLVIVGGGISGLSAAWFYRQRVNPQAKILILDNHDDFGGHAKRNEFMLDGRRIIGYGGSQSIDSPNSWWSATAKELLHELGVDVRRFETAFERTLYPSLGLSRGIFFAREAFGRDRRRREDDGEQSAHREKPWPSCSHHRFSLRKVNDTWAPSGA